jgi:predicted RNA-binding protein with PUA-like domain
MAYWFVRSEPDVYSIDDLKKDGSTTWDGVRNNAAALHLKAMKKGDEVIFYHSNIGKEVVGVAKVVKEAFPDPKDPTGRWVAVELGYVRHLPKAVPLPDLKAREDLSEMAMIRQSRLSVSPVRESEWKTILKMAGE